MLSPDSLCVASATTGTRLATHLQERYGIEVAAVAALDAGVFRVDRRDGPSWARQAFAAA
jgi:hypothetical protein